MQQPLKRGNGKRRPKRRRRPTSVLSETSGAGTPKPLARARLFLHDTDPITGREDRLFTLFYEDYRGYTIYSTESGACCIHGAGRGGCLRIAGKYVVFPDIEDAKTLIKWLRASGQSAQEDMQRTVPQEAYLCLNPPRRAQRARSPSNSCYIESLPQGCLARTSQGV
jgi:hypothetical protein